MKPGDLKYKTCGRGGARFASPLESLSPVTDNGFDPVLGPPYPPVNYQLFSHDTQPRLTWTVPDVFILANTVLDSPSGARVYVSNYTTIPDGTILRLFRGVPIYNLGVPNFIGSSLEGDIPEPPSIVQAAFNGPEVDGTPYWLLDRDSDPLVTGTHTYYVTATSGSTILVSNGVSITIHAFTP